MENYSNELELIWNFNGNPVRLRHVYNPETKKLTVWYHDLTTGETKKGGFYGYPPIDEKLKDSSIGGNKIKEGYSKLMGV